MNIILSPVSLVFLICSGFVSSFLIQKVLLKIFPNRLTRSSYRDAFKHRYFILFGSLYAVIYAYITFSETSSLIQNTWIFSLLAGIAHVTILAGIHFVARARHGLKETALSFAYLTLASVLYLICCLFFL